MNKKHQIPTPAHPRKRREALPWQQPKATEEDPEALRHVQAIVNSASYRSADKDIDFLARDGVRGVRLQIDYLKPELLLEEPPAGWGAAYCSPVFVDPIRFCVKCPTGRLRNGHFQFRGAPSNGLQSALISGGQRYKAEGLLGP